jgi:hypothetical protein
MIVLAALLLAAGVWGYFLYHQQKDKEARLNRLAAEITDLQGEVVEMRRDVRKLQIFEKWTEMYEETAVAAPAWDRLIGELGAIAPESLVLERLNLLTASDQGGPRTAEISGRIGAETWEEALAIFRGFGESLSASPYFGVDQILYAPQRLDEGRKVFDWRMTINLLPWRRS